MVTFNVFINGEWHITKSSRINGDVCVFYFWRAHFPGRRGDLQRKGVPLSLPFPVLTTVERTSFVQSVATFCTATWGGTVDETGDHLVDMFRKKGPCKIMGYNIQPIDQEFANYFFFVSFVSYC